MHLHWDVRLALGDASTSERLALTRGELTANANLTNDPRLDSCTACPFGNIANQLVGNVMLTLRIVRFWLRSVEVVARAHDDVEAGALADGGEAFRVAAIPVGACLNDGLATLINEALHLFDRKLNVLHGAVVFIDERVVLQLPDVADGNLLVDQFARSRRIVEWRMPPGEDIVQEVFVSQRQTHVCGADGAKNALYLLHVRRLACVVVSRGEAAHGDDPEREKQHRPKKDGGECKRITRPWRADERGG